MSFGIKQRFDGFEEEVEEAITEAVEGEQRSESQLSGIQQKAIKQKVVSIVERRLDEGPEADAGASKAAIAKSSGEGGGGSGLVSSEDRAAAIERAGGSGGSDDGSAAASKILGGGGEFGSVKRRVALLKGEADPRNAKEELVANAEGEKRERIIEMLETEVEGGSAAAIKRVGDEAGNAHSASQPFKRRGGIAVGGSSGPKRVDEE